MGWAEENANKQLAASIRQWMHQIQSCTACRLEKESESHRKEGDQNEERERGREREKVMPILFLLA
jgi:hypothetical protein